MIKSTGQRTGHVLNNYAGESAGRDGLNRFGPGEIHIDLIELKSKSIT